MTGFFYAAIERIPLGVAVIVEFIGPLTLAAVLSRRRADLVWIALAAVGVVALGLPGGGAALDLLGIAFALVAGGFWALYVLAGARGRRRAGAGRAGGRDGRGCGRRAPHRSPRGDAGHG
ncbi:MAG: hypothetical protein ABIQ18_03395 [Umezawaea sp.]